MSDERRPARAGAATGSRPRPAVGSSLPVDPDAVDAGEATARSSRRRGSHAPRFRLDVLAAVFAGGCVGGALRYVATSTGDPGLGRFPWATFAVNICGAFVLALVVVIAAELAPSRYLRPLLGTGFCGAFTTFSSVVVAADQMAAHRHGGLAAGYVAATAASGLAAASLGLVVARALAASRRRARAEGSSR